MAQYNNIRMDGGGWSPDADHENQNWLKQNWIYPHDMKSFLMELIGFDVENVEFIEVRQMVNDFMGTPRAEFMPDSLQDELELAGYIT